MMDDQRPPSSRTPRLSGAPGSGSGDKVTRRRPTPSTVPETPLSLLEELRRKAISDKALKEKRADQNPAGAPEADQDGAKD